MRKYRSPVFEEILNEMKKDRWYVKIKRWFKLQVWIYACLTRKYWDKSYKNNIFNKK
jgi:hypothetical protein